MVPFEAPDRTEPRGVEPDERRSYEAWLDYHRATLLVKCAGLDGEQLARRAVPPSTLSLLGLVRHMTEVERGWFREVLDGQKVAGPYSTPERRDADFEDLDQARAADDVAAYRAEVEEVRRVAARHDLDDRGPDRLHGQVDLRWIYLHMIEEYARHNGHADLLRECIDGATGD